MCANPNNLHAVRIEGQIKLSDGSVTSFAIQRDIGWQQWGNPTEQLGATVELLEGLANAMRREGDDD